MTSNKTRQVEHNFLHISKWFIKRCQTYRLMWLKGLMEDLINWCSIFNDEKQFANYGSQNHLIFQFLSFFIRLLVPENIFVWKSKGFLKGSVKIPCFKTDLYL